MPVKRAHHFHLASVARRTRSSTNSHQPLKRTGLPTAQLAPPKEDGEGISATVEWVLLPDLDLKRDKSLEKGSDLLNLGKAPCHLRGNTRSRTASSWLAESSLEALLFSLPPTLELRHLHVVKDCIEATDLSVPLHEPEKSEDQEMRPKASASRDTVKAEQQKTPPAMRNA